LHRQYRADTDAPVNDSRVFLEAYNPEVGDEISHVFVSHLVKGHRRFEIVAGRVTASRYGFHQGRLVEGAMGALIVLVSGRVG
jgi:hypothetical protein